MKTNLMFQKCFLLFTCFVLIFNSAGQLASIGVLFPEMMYDFQSSRAETALVQSVAYGLFLLSGIVTGVVLKWIGSRKAGTFGALLMAFGYGVAYFVPNIYLLISTGVFTGIGASFQMVTGMTISSTCFEGRYRFLAISVTSLGAGVGSMVMPFVLVFLEGEFGLRGAFLITGGVILQTVPCVYCMGLLSRDIVSVAIPLPSDVICSDRKSPSRLREFWKFICNIVRNEQYLMGPVCVAFGTAVLGVLLFLVVDILISKGLTKSDGVFALFLMSVMSLVGRILPGVAKLCPYTSTLHVVILVYVVGGTALVLLPSVTDYYLTFVLTSAIGLSHGTSITSVFSTTTKVVPREMFSTATGVALSVHGVVTICLPPITGYMKDKTGSYDNTSVVSGCVLLVCAIIVSIAYVLRICRQRANYGPETETHNMSTTNDTVSTHM
ncbi:hypothetical protein ScPMuIL_008226 [Solemya velum]